MLLFWKCRILAPRASAPPSVCPSMRSRIRWCVEFSVTEQNRVEKPLIVIVHVQQNQLCRNRNNRTSSMNTRDGIQQKDCVCIMFQGWQRADADVLGGASYPLCRTSTSYWCRLLSLSTRRKCNQGGDDVGPGEISPETWKWIHLSSSQVHLTL